MCFKNIDTSHKLYSTLVPICWARIRLLLQQLTMMIRSELLDRLIDRLIKMQKKIKLIAVAVLSAVGLSASFAQTDSHEPSANGQRNNERIDYANDRHYLGCLSA